jgi:glycosyltransferase involved in cell wall biosynthesis
MDRRRRQTGVTRPLTILRIIARLNVGGPARHVTLLDAGLRDRGHRTLLVHGDVGPGEASLDQLVCERGLPAIRVAELGPRISLWSDLRAFAAVLQMVFRARPDIIHTHTAKAGALGRVCAAIYNMTRRRSRRAAVVHTFHGHVLSGYFGPIGSTAVRVAERLLATITDCIVTISPTQQQDIANRFRIAPAARVVMIPLGLDLSSLLVLEPTVKPRNAAGIPPVVTFGYMGRFVPIKDLPTLIAAFARAVQSVNSCRLVLAGDGPASQAIRDLIEQHGIREQVTFLGWTNDLPRFYAMIDVCVLASLNEGTPVAIIEAMSAGKAVIATNVGGIPDIVDDQRTGILVNARDVQGLADAMIQLARNVEQRVELGVSARSEVRGRFSHERLIDDIEELYGKLLVRKRGSSRS